jgi:transcriptional regulator with XRE-family HTH domain
MNLRELRTKKDLTQAKLGALIGTSQRHVSEIETKKRKAPPKYAERIRDLFGLTTEQMWEMLYRDSA